MFLDITVRTRPIALRDVSGSTHDSPHRNRQEEYEGSSCDFSSEAINVARHCAEGQTIIDELNIELEGVMAEVAEPKRQARRRANFFNFFDRRVPLFNGVVAGEGV